MNNCINLYFNNVIKILNLGSGVTNKTFTHPDRKLNWNVFLFITEGAMEVWEEDKEYIVSKGQYLFLKSGLHHFGEAKTPASTRWYWIHFYDNLTNEACQESNFYHNTPYKLELTDEDYDQFVILPKYGTVAHPNSLEMKMNQMIEVYHSVSPFRAITLSIGTLELLLSIYKESGENHKLMKSDYTVKKIMEFLENRPHYSLSAKELELHLDMNYSYLCNVFKSKTGNTIHDYNARIFIYKAIHFMRTSNMSISEISEMLGFNNPFYFNKVFRKVMNCSPSVYLSQIYHVEPFIK
ncbi:MAG: AraC family transcriptional regulator [Anaerocolumna sp.]